MMYNEKFFDDFKNRKFVVNCPTHESSVEFLKQCQANCINWSFCSATSNDYWHKNKEKTMYICNKNSKYLLWGKIDNPSVPYFDIINSVNIPCVIFKVNAKCDLCFVCNTCNKERCIKNDVK